MASRRVACFELVACRNGCKCSFRPWPLRDTLRVSRVPLTTHRHGAAGAGRFYWPARRKRRHGVEPFQPPVLLPLHATGHQHPPGTGEPRAPPSTPLRHRSSPATSTLADRTRAANHGGVGDRYDPASTSQSPIHTAWRRCRDERRRRNGGRCRNSSSSSSLGAGGRSTRPTNAAARARPAHAQNGGRQPAGASLCPSSWPRDPTPSHTLRTPLPRQDEVAVLAAAVSLLRTISATGGRPSGPVEADESCDRPHKRQELGQSCFGQGVDPQRKPAAAASSRRRATGPRRTTGSSTKEPLPPEKVSVLLQHFHSHQYVSPEVRETHAMCRCAVPCLKTHGIYACISSKRGACSCGRRCRRSSSSTRRRSALPFLRQSQSSLSVLVCTHVNGSGTSRPCGCHQSAADRMTRYDRMARHCPGRWN